jgi:cytochrome b561
MLLLIAAVYALMEFRDIFPRGSDPREAMKAWHYTLGLTVFGLVWLRLIARLIGGTPPITPAPPRWQARLGGLVHVLLYALMIGMPLGGWLILSAEGDPIPFFGLTLPPLTGPNEQLAELIEEIHETGAEAGYALIALHAAASLVHHYLMRDDTLRRMLPGRR